MLAFPFTPQLIIRVISVLLVVLIVVLFSHDTTLLVFFALALGHITMAFLYQRDAKKWNQTKLILAILGFAALAVFCNLYTTLGFIAANIAFVFHMLWDEVHLFNKKTSLVRTLEMLPFLVLWGSIFIHAASRSNFFFEAYGIAVLCVVVRLLLAFQKQYAMDVATYVLGGWTLLALGGTLIVQHVGLLVPASVWFFGLVTVHFFIWYGDYYRRVAPNIERRYTYIRRTLITNGISGLLAIIFAVTSAPIFLIFFSIGFANAWSLLHILTSIRFATLRGSLGISS